jgi:hypothetical protein
VQLKERIPDYKFACVKFIIPLFLNSVDVLSKTDEGALPTSLYSVSFPEITEGIKMKLGGKI